MSRLVRLAISFGILTLVPGLLAIDGPELVAARPVQGSVISLGIDLAIVAPGDSVAVAVSAEARPPGIGAYTIDVLYDASLVTATDCESAPGASPAACDTEFDGDTVRLSGVFIEGRKGTVTLGTITFEARANEGITDLIVTVETLADPDGNAILPLEVNDGAIFILAAPPGTPSPPPGPTATPFPPAPTATPMTTPPPLATPMPSPLPTGTLAPTTATPGTQERDLTIEYKETIKAGEQAIITVTVSLPAISVQAPGLPGYIQVVVNTPGAASLLIYFKPPDPTGLTLQVGADNFETGEYTPSQTQDIFPQTKKVQWTVTISPKPGVSGNQDVTVTLTQELPEGAVPPPGFELTFTKAIRISVETPGESTFDKVMEVLRWAVPGGLASLIAGAAALNWRRIWDFIGKLTSRS